jgi:hypothetical protein
MNVNCHKLRVQRTATYDYSHNDLDLEAKLDGCCHGQPPLLLRRAKGTGISYSMGCDSETVKIKVSIPAIEGMKTTLDLRLLQTDMSTFS